MDSKQSGKDSKPRKARGPGKFTSDLRATIHQAFYKAGGRDYLVKIAHTRPDVFLGLVGRVIPQETRVSLLASYQAMPVRVEARDALPALTPPREVLEAVAVEVCTPPTSDDDWLDRPSLNALPHPE